MIYKCLIVDDEPLAHKVLEKYIAQTEFLSLAGNCYNAPEAHAFLSSHTVDILFLDIKMPEVSGISFLKTLTDPPSTILTTAFRSFALEGFDVGAIDYLLKPIDFERFTKAVERATEWINLKKLETADATAREQSENAEKFENGEEPERAVEKEVEKNNIMVKVGMKKYILPFEDITHVEGLKDYTIVYTQEKKHIIKGYIKLIENILPAQQFVRVHKSYIVAKNKIRFINHNKIEFDGYKIPIGRRFKKTIDALVV